jgi:hypothetical protein
VTKTIQTRRADNDRLRQLVVASYHLLDMGVDFSVHNRANGDVVFTFTYPSRLKVQVDEALLPTQ